MPENHKFLSQSFSSQYSDDSEKSIGFLFMKTYYAWHNTIKEALKKYDLTHPQFVILATLGYLASQYDEVTQVMLAEHANNDVMTTSQILGRLEKNALIKRSIAKKDSRAKAITLTKAGYALVNLTVPIVEEIDKAFFSTLNECTLPNIFSSTKENNADCFRLMLLALIHANHEP